MVHAHDVLVCVSRAHTHITPTYHTHAVIIIMCNTYSNPYTHTASHPHILDIHVHHHPFSHDLESSLLPCKLLTGEVTEGNTLPCAKWNSPIRCYLHVIKGHDDVTRSQEGGGMGEGGHLADEDPLLFRSHVIGSPVGVGSGWW